MAYELFGAIRIGSVEQELCIYEIGPSKGVRPMPGWMRSAAC